ESDAGAAGLRGIHSCPEDEQGDRFAFALETLQLLLLLRGVGRPDVRRAFGLELRQGLVGQRRVTDGVVEETFGLRVETSEVLVKGAGDLGTIGGATLS